jgi:DNA-binding NarL/FixJ family response regulator
VKSAVAIYGVAGGLLIAALKFVEYRFLVVEHSVEIYGGLVAVLFSAAGIWLGLTLTTKREVVLVREVPAPAAREAVAVAAREPVAAAARESLAVAARESLAVAAREPFAVNQARVRELGITPRELEILQHIARGLSTKEMAATLFVSENTVKTHTSRLLDKLGVNRRIKAVEAGRTLGLLP